MLRSMTGFGQAERTFAGYEVQVEIRSFNHRYCEVIIRQPREWTRYEDMLRKTVQQHIKRGRVEIHINAERQPSSERRVAIEWSLLQAYYEAAEQIRDRLNLSGPITLQEMMLIPDAVQFHEQKAESGEDIEQQLQQCLLDALSPFMRMRETEGMNLHTVLADHLHQIELYRAEVACISPIVVEEYKQKLDQRIREMLKQEHTVDETRLAMEVAVFADKCNLDEELARLQSHMQQFRQLMADEDPSGRRMDFLIQEMNREVNTMGSKANHVHVTNHVVAMKAELEKLREQVQNIE